MTDQDTPMMRQYKRIKQKHNDSILFFRLGDFYEMFNRDAKEVSSILNLTLTKRHGIPMCGIPYHAAQSYISRLLRAGKKIAICEQTSMPAGGKGIAEREVVEIITPGTVVDEDFLDKGRNNYLMAAGKHGKFLSIAYADLSTGEFYASAYEASQSYEILKRELLRIAPGELLIQETLLDGGRDTARLILDQQNLLVNRFPDWAFDMETSVEQLKKQFGVLSLKGFGIDEGEPAVYSCGIILDYISDNSKSLLPHIRNLKILNDSEFLNLDESSLRNLEITRNMQDGGKRYTLLEVMDYTKTAMGARKLKNWLVHPLSGDSGIKERQERVQHLYHNQILLNSLTEKLSTILDIERLSSRIAMEKAHAKDLLSVRNSIEAVEHLAAELAVWEQSGGIGMLPAETLESAGNIRKLLQKSIDEDPSIVLTEGRLIKAGYNEELDRLKGLKENSRKILNEYLEKEKQESGISTLKIRYNRIIGYYLEVTKSFLPSVPEHFIRRQSLVSAERYTTDRLIELETDLNSASENAVQMEKELFLEIRNSLKSDVGVLLEVSEYISTVDCFVSMARAATIHGWVKPEINKKKILDIKGGRHPVVEANLPSGEFIPNDIRLGPGEKSFALITGPNMAGKSTFLRQTALIVLMAQTGSFVPADSAVIGAVDRIFCRVGASDNLARGESTFLVEMNETANILRTATDRSLVIMDEVGRGTGTNDGLSLAWAISEHILNRIKSKTLFATHYHELTSLEHKSLENLSLDVRERPEGIVFLKKIKKGPADSSYGVHVAKLAGLPAEVIERARVIQGRLEKKEISIAEAPASSGKASVPELFSMEELLVSEISSFDLNNSTPLSALNFVARLRELIKA